MCPKIKVNLKKLGELSKKYPLSYEVMLYDKNKGRRKVMKSKTSKKKYTLNQIGDALFNFINYATNEFKQLNVRIDKVETRLDNIETRLDYIVTANKLKDLPKNSK